MKAVFPKKWYSQFIKTSQGSNFVRVSLTNRNTLRASNQVREERQPWLFGMTFHKD